MIDYNVDQQNLQNNEPSENVPIPEDAKKLDMVRDILFGIEIREIDQRLNNLDETIVRVTSQIRTEFHEHILSLEQALKALSDLVAETRFALNREKVDKARLAESFESIASRLREDYDKNS